MRQGPWKLILPNRKVFYNYVKDRGSNEIELYHLESDIGETKNVAAENSAVVEKLRRLAAAYAWPAQLFDPGLTLPRPAGAPKRPFN